MTFFACQTFKNVKEAQNIGGINDNITGIYPFTNYWVGLSPRDLRPCVQVIRFSIRALD